MKKLVKVVLALFGAALVLGMASCSNGSDSPNPLVPPATPATDNTGNGGSGEGGSQQQTVTTYTITVANGTAKNASGTVVTNAASGDIITIIANDSTSGKTFDKWTTSSVGVTFASETVMATTFTMPPSDLSVTATYKNLASAPEGCVSVPAKYFNGEAISGSTVFITNRVMCLPAVFVSDHEVTQKEYATYCNFSQGQSPNTQYGVGNELPAYYIAWNDAIIYCNLKSEADGLTPVYKLSGSTDTKNWNGIVSSGGKYCGPGAIAGDSILNAWKTIEFDTTANGWRLPTEAEWECLARDGNLTNVNQTTYSGSSTIGDVAWYSANSGNKAHKVKTNKVENKDSANSLGLYDMSGNVCEWCWDLYNTIEQCTVWIGPEKDKYSIAQRVYRCGSFSNSIERSSIAYRAYEFPTNRFYNIGFRVVRNAD